MKPTAFVVDTARGGVVAEDALAEALERETDRRRRPRNPGEASPRTDETSGTPRRISWNRRVLGARASRPHGNWACDPQWTVDETPPLPWTPHVTFDSIAR